MSIRQGKARFGALKLKKVGCHRVEEGRGCHARVVQDPDSTSVQEA